MSAWPLVKVSDACEMIVDCVNRTAPLASEPTPYKMIRTTNVRDGFIDTDNVRYVDEATFRRWTRRAVPLPGDVVLTREAPLGEVGIIRTAESVFLGQRTIMYRSDPDKLDPYFLMYSMRSEFMQGQIHSYGSGATVEHMRLPDCFSLLLPFPPLPIQRKITAILSAYDDLIDNNKRRIKLLEEMAQRIYYEWFVDFRDPGFERVPLVPSDSGPIPEGWGLAPLSALAAVVMGQSPPSSAYNRTAAGLPFHQGVGSYGAHFPVHDVYSTSGDRLAERGDILVSVRAPVGRINIADSRLILGRGLSAIRVREARHGFLLHALKHFFREEDVMGNGSIFKSVTKRDFEGLPLLWPGDALADRFSILVDPMWRELQVLTVEVANLGAARDLLLPQLISHEIDVTDLDIALPEVAT